MTSSEDRMPQHKARDCICVGPMYGEPYCYCQMVDKCLELSAERRAIIASIARLQPVVFETYEKPYARTDQDL